MSYCEKTCSALQLIWIRFPIFSLTIKNSCIRNLPNVPIIHTSLILELLPFHSPPNPPHGIAHYYQQEYYQQPQQNEYYPQSQQSQDYPQSQDYQNKQYQQPTKLKGMQKARQLLFENKPPPNSNIEKFEKFGKF